MDLDINNKNCFNIEFLDLVRQYILVINANLPKTNPQKWVQYNKSRLHNLLLNHGGILLRNFDINSISEFSEFAYQISPNLLNYEYGSTPRKKLGDKIYTATEYPPDRSIPLHNEHSYAHKWPSIIIFFCIIPPEQGGETPLADSRLVYKKIDKNIIKAFEETGILYVRNYTKGIDLSWQEVFQTTNRKDVEDYCIVNKINYEWLRGDNGLITKQISQATLLHPVLGDKVWFNQAHLFHASNLANYFKEYIMDINNGSFPRNSYYGNGTLIEDKDITHIQEVYKKQMVIFKWQKGDILLLDNISTAHGRMPFTGKRKILVAMV